MLTWVLILLVGLPGTLCAAPKGAAPHRGKKSLAPAEVIVSTTPISVMYPADGRAMDTVRGELILGAVSHPKRAFRINGSTVTVHPKGGFLAYLPVHPGTFTFRCELDLPQGTTFLLRTIHVAEPEQVPAATSFMILPESVWPAEDLELQPSDWLSVRMRATPGLSGTFSISGLHRTLPMIETHPGLYEGAYRIRPDDKFALAQISVALKKGSSTVRAKAPGKLTASDKSPVTVLVRSPGIVNVRSAPNEGFILFPPLGTKLLVSGRIGNTARIELSPTLSGWLESKALEEAPTGSPPPRAVLGTIATERGTAETALELELNERVPFRIEESADLMTVQIELFYTVGHTNWIIYDPKDTFVHQVRWSQEDAGTVLVTISLNPRQALWGYEAVWKDKTLRLVLKRPPLMAPPPASVFSGRVIVIDPGHEPSAPGAIGPLGTLEVNANFWLAKDLEALLVSEGAKPVLTRSSQEEASLTRRSKQAKSLNGEIFVSVHNNAFSDGEDPFATPHGFSVFYYHPHSMALARSVYRSYERLAPIPGEGLRYGDLYVARMTEMPSILTESSYLTFPEQEQMLLSPQLRRKFAAAIAEGLRDFLEAERQRQLASGVISKAPPQKAEKDSQPAKNKRRHLKRPL